MSYFKRFLLLGSLGMVLLTGLMFASNTNVGTAHASGCNTVAQGFRYIFDQSGSPDWSNNCTVSEGNISNFVYAIQTVVTYSGTGCTTKGIDGSFGTNTYNGVRCFQGKAHIGVDGIVGPQTWGALSNYVYGGFTSSGWNYFHVGSNSTNYFRMWGQAPYKWYVNAGGCWRLVTVNSSSC